MSNIQERARKAFDPEFRDLLCNSVQRVILEDGLIGTSDVCYCPEGCLFYSQGSCFNGRPLAIVVHKNYPGFTHTHHCSFQTAFDFGTDDGTPEAALGLLYRERFIK